MESIQHADKNTNESKGNTSGSPQSNLYISNHLTITETLSNWHAFLLLIQTQNCL